MANIVTRVFSPQGGKEDPGNEVAIGLRRRDVSYDSKQLLPAGRKYHV